MGGFASALCAEASIMWAHLAPHFLLSFIIFFHGAIGKNALSQTLYLTWCIGDIQ